ncbi:MAG: T9SS type A sorting domain-containing protein, partial [Rubricoccaceae bacterium]|nr:T9SS type A sorting domain-containing protein [Rubricoccaceae bacterium]
YWAEATLPNQQIRFLFGPVVVNGTPGTTVSLTLQQRVPNAAPLGSYVFRMVVGAYPGTLYDDDSFPVSVVAGAALATHPLRSRSAVTGPASAHRGGETPRAASVGRRAAPSRVVNPSDVPAAVARRIAATPDAWLAWDEQGAILEAGLVQDLRVPGDETARRERRVPDRDGADRARSGFSAMAPSHATGLPTDVTLDAPFPNPAAGRMTLRFGLPDAGVVRMTVYNALGRRVARLIAGTRDAGWHEAVLDGRHLPRGVYSVRLEAGSRVLTCRATLLR